MDKGASRISLNLTGFTDWRDDTGSRWGYRIVVDADGDDVFYDALDRTVRSDLGASLEKLRGDDQRWILFWIMEEGRRTPIRADYGLLVREVEQFFGNLAHEDPPAIEADTRGGIGGGHIPDLFELLLRAAEIYGVWEFIKTVDRKAHELRHRRGRRLGLEWTDTGKITTEFQRALFAEPYWSAERLVDEFGLDRAQVRGLMVSIGYESDDHGNWFDPNGPDRYRGGV